MVRLRPNPTFVPKISASVAMGELTASHPPPFVGPDDQNLDLLCPFHALRTYVDRARSFRRSDQLFVCYASLFRGSALSVDRLLRWIVDCIALAYESSGTPVPARLRARSSRGVAVSWALFSRGSLSVTFVWRRLEPRYIRLSGFTDWTLPPVACHRQCLTLPLTSETVG